VDDTDDEATSNTSQSTTPCARKIADLPPTPPGYNITPGTFQPVVRLSEETGEREMSLMEWGLVPYWSKMHKMVSNCARDDKLTISGAWIKPFQQRRCLIPAEFFYEWEVPTPEDKKRKITKPWAVALTDDRLFSFGGIWDRWKDRGVFCITPRKGSIQN
jgi:putative SOS response-associated peptidase YedK